MSLTFKDVKQKMINMVSKIENDKHTKFPEFLYINFNI